VFLASVLGSEFYFDLKNLLFENVTPVSSVAFFKNWALPEHLFISE
jgi:hypothetical protein